MTFQEAAYEILIKMGRPLGLMEIAEIALGEGMINSKAKDRHLSFAKTIRSNINRGKTRGPKLIFIDTPKGKLVGLPEWQ